MLAKTETTEPKVVNGINVDNLLALIEGVRHDAAKGNTRWRVTTVWQGQARSRAHVEGFAIGGQEVPREFLIDIDEPYELGGSNRFANPQEHLLAALNACMMVGYAAQCAVRGITLEKNSPWGQHRHLSLESCRYRPAKSFFVDVSNRARCHP